MSFNKHKDPAVLLEIIKKLESAQNVHCIMAVDTHLVRANLVKARLKQKLAIRASKSPK